MFENISIRKSDFTLGHLEEAMPGRLDGTDLAL